MKGFQVQSTLLLLVACLACQNSGSPNPTPEPQVRASSVVASSSPAEAEEGLLLIFLGDSLTAGLGVPEEKAFPALLETSLHTEDGAVHIINAGVSGDTTAGGLSRVHWLLRQEPDLLVVELGGNDALRGQPLEGIEENLRRLIRESQDRNVPVLLLGMQAPPSYGPDYANGFAEIYPRIARDLGVALVPSFLRKVGGRASLNLIDGIHPSEKGHELLATEVLPYLQKMVDAILEQEKEASLR